MTILNCWLYTLTAGRVHRCHHAALVASPVPGPGVAPRLGQAAGAVANGTASIYLIFLSSSFALIPIW